MEGERQRREMSAAVLKTALAIEEFGINFYSEMSECVADSRGAALLRSLGNDEREHLRIIQKELDHLDREGMAEEVEPLQEYLRILPERVFVRPKGACLALNDEIAALEKGLEVEVNSINMYQDALTRALEPRARSSLEELARWEVKHKEILEENLRSLRLEGAWYGYGPILEG